MESKIFRALKLLILGCPFGKIAEEWYPLTSSKFLFLKYLLISKKLKSELKPFNKSFLLDYLGVSGRVVPQNYVQIVQTIVRKISTDIKKLDSYLKPLKNVLEVPFGGYGLLVPPNYVKIFFNLKSFHIKKSALA